MSLVSRRPLLAAGLVAVSLLMAACQMTIRADGEPTPRASADDGPGVETSVFDLEVGNCFSATGDTIETITVVPCDEAHIYEAFDVVRMPGDDEEPYPGDEAVLAFADAECRGRFEDYVGVPYLTSRFFLTPVTPSEETWARGDRDIVCTLNLRDDAESTGSARGSGR